MPRTFPPHRHDRDLHCIS